MLLRTELAKCILSILMYSCDHIICPDLSVLFYMPQLIRSEFLKLEAFSCDFKIDCILVFRLTSLNREWWCHRENLMFSFHDLLSVLL